MGIPEERIQVLKMVQSGQISVEEGARLLKALEEKQPSREPRQLRVQVTDLDTGRQKVNISMPWNLVSVGIRMGARFARQEIRLEDFVETIKAGAEGKIVDVVDEEERERVEIFVE